MSFKVDFDFQQGMRSLGRLSRRAYDKAKDFAEEQQEAASETEDGTSESTENKSDRGS